MLSTIRVIAPNELREIQNNIQETSSSLYELRARRASAKK